MKQFILALAILLMIWGFYRGFVQNPNAETETANNTRQPIVRNGSPSWSPNGEKIIFYSDKEGNDDIFIMNENGSGLKRLTSNPASEGYPTISPDGSLVVFDSNRDGNYDIYIMNIDGSDQRKLTGNPANDVSASWSPDGSKLAFMSFINGAFAIRIMNADGSNLVTLTDEGWFPRWSPDGSQITFNSHNDTYLINVTGSNSAPIKIAVGASYPTWSPSGARIAYQSRKEGNQDIYIMDSDGSSPVKITTTVVGDLIDPRWSPDGSKFVYAYLPNGNQYGPSIIYVMNANGSNQVALTNK